MSQARLAEVAGISTIYVRKIEAGQANPTLHVTERLAAALGLDGQNLPATVGRASDGSLPTSGHSDKVRPLYVDPALVQEATERLRAFSAVRPGTPTMWTVVARDRPWLAANVTAAVAQAGLNMRWLTVTTDAGEAGQTATLSFAAVATSNQQKAVYMRLREVKGVTMVNEMSLSLEPSAAVVAV